MPLDPQWALQFRDAVTTNDIQLAAELLSQCDDAPCVSEPIDENHLWNLVDFTISWGRVAILEALVAKFKNLSHNGRILSTYCLYQSFRDGQMECAQALQVVFPGEVFFCLPHAVKCDQIHMLEHFLPQFNPDITDLTRLLIEAWDCNSVRCFAYVLPQCSYLDGDAMAARFRFSVEDSTEFCAHFHAQRQKLVLEEQVSGGCERVRKM